MDIALVKVIVNGVVGLFPAAPGGVTSFVSALVDELPALDAAGADTTAFLKDQFAVAADMIAENRGPTEAEWGALNATVQAELAQLRAQTTP